MLYNYSYVVTSLQSIPDATLCRRVSGRIVLTNQRIVENKIYTLSFLLSEAFLSAMAAFQFAVNRIIMNYG